MKDYIEHLKDLNINELENTIKKYNLKENEEIKNAICEYNKNYPNFLVDLCKRIYGRCELFEKYIEEDSCACYEYGKCVIKGRLPENMHNRMLAKQLSGKFDAFVKYYFKDLKI